MNWCFWTVVLEKTLESPLDCKESQPVHSEGDQPWDFFGRNDAKAETPVLMRRVDSLEKTLMLGKIEGGRRGWQRMRWLDGITDSMERVWVNSGSWWWTGRPGVLQFMGSQRAGHDWETELNWTDSKNAVPSSIVLRIIFRVHSDALSSLFNRWSYAEGYLPIFLFVQIVPQIIELNLKANHLYLLHLFLF